MMMASADQIRSESGAHVSPVGRRPAARDLLDGRFQISTADRALDFLAVGRFFRIPSPF
jgi:hypothetical protein